MKTVLVVDDDPDIILMMRAILGKAGYHVLGETNSLLVMERLEQEPIDCILLDIMMPGMDGLQLCQLIRGRSEWDSIKVVMVSAKPYDFDRQRALQFGADAYFVKPIEPRLFLEGLERLFQDAVQLCFWGVRGTLPIPGPHSIQYGGNTNCITMHLTKGPLFVFDAGTGIKTFSDHLLATKTFPVIAKILLSHPHWDHINGLPFFVPLYIKGNDVEICCGSQQGISTRKMISDQMDGVYFPIKIKEFSARVYFRDLQEETWEVGHGAKVSTMLLNHPGTCLGYRIDYGRRKIAYITDHELHPATSPYHNPAYEKKLIRFVEQADVLIMDATFNEAQYVQKSGWGHSTARQAALLAHLAQVKTLCLHHHDPDQRDEDITVKLEEACVHLQELRSTTRCVAPREGEIITV
ncbi:MAG: response regulator [Magnetococcus sp. YQC-5]